jgi:Domain of unknown function (DUF4932)/IclR helix-turn-helix domain
MLASDVAGEGDVIQVVSRAFDVLRCFEGHEARLGNLEISNRCGLPRSTVSRLTHTLTRMGQLVYLPRDQKYRIGPSAVAMSTAMMRGQGYGTWDAMINESLVRAAVPRYYLAHGDSARATADITSQVKAGFVWMRELVALLGEYEHDRARYATFDLFMPRVVELFTQRARSGQ